STSYSLALTALKGRNTPREYTMEALVDPQIRAFASKVRVVQDDVLTNEYVGKLPARVTVRTTAGAVHEELVINAKGSPGQPLSSQDVDEKFRSQVANILGAENCEKLLRTLRNIDALDKISNLPPLFVVQPGR